MEIFGFLIPIFPELLTIVLGLVVVYLVILELEFRQVRAISNRFSIEEKTLEREIKEFRMEINEFKEHLGMMAEIMGHKKPLPSQRRSLEGVRALPKAKKPASAKYASQTLRASVLSCRILVVLKIYILRKIYQIYD